MLSGSLDSVELMLGAGGRTGFVRAWTRLFTSNFDLRCLHLAFEISDDSPSLALMLSFSSCPSAFQASP